MLENAVNQLVLAITSEAREPFIGLLLRSNLIIAVALLVTCLMRRQPASFRHLIWQGCLLSLLLLPLFMRLLPVLEIPIAAQLHGLGGYLAHFSLQPAGSGMMQGLQLLLLLYALVAAGLLLYAVLGLLHISLLTRRAVPAAHSTAQLLAALLREEGPTRTISVLESPSLSSPVSWGLVRPVILLPPKARQWPASKVRHVLIHELAHIQRLDWSSQLLARLLCALYWYNPLVWYSRRKLEEEAECACDDAVLLQGNGHCDYAANLLNIARQVQVQGRGHRRGLVQAIADCFLGQRLRVILDREAPRCLSEAIYPIRGLLICLPLLVIISSVKLVPQASLPPAQRIWPGNLIPVTYVPRPAHSTTASAGAASVLPRLSDLLPRQSPPPLSAGARRSRPAAPVLAASLGEIRIRTAIAPLHPANLQSPISGARALRPLDTAVPEYPAHARQNGIEGYTLVEYSIMSDGQVDKASIVESRPAAVFDRVSLQAIKRYTYAPLQLNGEAVTVHGVRTRFIYRLRLKPG